MKVQLVLNNGLDSFVVFPDETQYYYIVTALKTGRGLIYTNKQGMPKSSLMIPVKSIAYIEVLEQDAEVLEKGVN